MKSKLIFNLICLSFFVPTESAHNINCPHLNILSETNQAPHGVHKIAEEVECECKYSRNSAAHSRMCRGDGVKEPPFFLLQGAIDSIQEDNRRYPSDAGFSHTRKIVLQFIEEKFGIPGLSIHNLCPNNGVSDSFAKTIALLIKKNDIVVSFAPTFGLHSRAVNNFNGQVIPIDVLDKKGYLPTIEELEAHIIHINSIFENQAQNIESLDNDLTVIACPRVKLLVLINPSNPLGKVITDTPANREYYKKIYELAEKYNFMIFDDLVYWGTEHDHTQRAMPFLKAVPEALDRTIMAFGPSKAIGGARMRSGMLVGPEWFINEVRKIVLNVNSGISAFNQYVMAAAFNMIYETEREEFLKRNAEEYALRRDVCIVGIEGKSAILNLKQYEISKERLEEIEHFVSLVYYAEILIREYEQEGIPKHIQDALLYYETLKKRIKLSLENTQWFKTQTPEVQDAVLQHNIKQSIQKEHFPEELHLISYVFYRELKNKSAFTIPKQILPYLDSVYMSSTLRSIMFPERYKQEIRKKGDWFMQGTKYLKIYSIPEATFFLTLNVSGMIGKNAPVNITRMAKDRAKRSKEGFKIPQGKDIAKVIFDNIKPSPILSSYEINLLFSWLGEHNYISGELMNVDPKRGLLRMTYAEPPIIFLEAIASIRHVEEYVKSHPNISLWIRHV